MASPATVPASASSQSSPPAVVAVPASVQAFLTANNLPLELLTQPPTLPRYVRVNPRTRRGSRIGTEATDERAELEKELNTPVAATALPSFYSLSSDVLIASSASYQSGRVYGMDLASGASVLALDVQVGEHILDLCAAPGNKLALIADWMAEKASSSAKSAASSNVEAAASSCVAGVPASSGSVTGVDWNYQRLAGARTLARKYGLIGSGGHRSHQSQSGVFAADMPPPLMRLFLADGQTFDARPPMKAEFDERVVAQGHIVDLTGKAVAGDTNGIASSQPYHCASASTSSSISSTDGAVLRVNKKQKRAMKKQAAREEWERRTKLKTADGTAAAETTAEPAIEEPKEAEDSTGNANSKHASASMEDVTAPAGDAPLLYDRVLVDAECTHDGAAKHIAKLIQPAPESSSSSTDTATSPPSTDWSSLSSKFLDPARLSSLQTLQRALISNGFRLMKDGGTMVYSTCSYARAQNEEIVEWMLEQQPSAESVAVFEGLGQIETVASSSPAARLERVRFPSAALPFTYQLGTPSRPTDLRPMGIRMDPITSGTSGLYVAKIRKRIAADETARS
jgi:16S rRNA C967 or C1407 C5-methylase (RsmB/RsmF family)